MIRITVRTSPDVLPRLRKFAEELRPALEEAWEEMAGMVTVHLEERCPDPDTEYDLLMRGGNDYPLVPRSGETSADSDPRGNTVRFIRAPGVWLQELVAMPGNWMVSPSTLYAGFGNVIMLDDLSRFSWVTYSGESRTSPPMWSFFEMGKGATVTPRGPNKVLHPAEKVILASVDKSYPAFRMYSGYNPTRVFSLISKAVEKAANS